MANPTTRSTGNGRRSIRNAKFGSNLVRRLDLEWWARLKAQREQDPAWVAKRDKMRQQFEAQMKALDERCADPSGWIFTDPRTGATLTVSAPVPEPTPWWERLVRWVAGH